MTQRTGRERTAAARSARTMIKHRRWAEELRAAGWEIREPNATWCNKMITALKNFEWLASNRDASIDWYSETVLVENGGFVLGVLAEAGCTPATRE